MGHNHCFPSTLNHLDNFVYISLYLYGGNVHFFVAYPTNLGERWGGNTINSPSKPSKPRTSLPQTSDVCAVNLGTFHRRSPMFSVSGRCFTRKFPDFRPFCPEIPNLQPLFFLLRFPLSWSPKPFSAPQNLKLFWQNFHPPLQGDKQEKHTSTIYKVGTETIFLLRRCVFFWWLCAQKGSPVKAWSWWKDKNHKNPLKRMGAKPLVPVFRFGLIRASS